MSVGMVSVDNAPRDMQGLLQLKRGVRSRLAATLGLITSDAEEAAFHMAPDEESCQALLAAIQNHDAGGGQLHQLSPQQPPIAQMPQQPQQMAMPPQYQPTPGTQLQLPPIQQQIMPPLAAPQPMMAPMGQPMGVQQPYQMQLPAVVPPQQPMGVQYPQQQQYPQQYMQQPQLQQQPQYPPPQMPQQMQQAPMMLPPVQMPPQMQQPQITPPAQQQAPVRAPSTRSDPTNAGEARGRSAKAAPVATAPGVGVVAPPTQPAAGATGGPILQIQQQMVETLQKLAETSAKTQKWLEEQQVRQSQLLAAILQIQLYMAEQAGIDSSTISRSIRVTGSDTVANYLKELEGEAEGK